MTEILGIGLPVFILAFALYYWQRNKKKYAEDVYTSDKSKAHYGRHIGRRDTGLDDSMRELVYEKYGRECDITGRNGIKGNPDNNGEHLAIGFGLRRKLYVNHVVPHALGGETEIENLRPIDAELNQILSDCITPMAEAYCRERNRKIWRRGIKRMTFEEAKKKLARKKSWRLK